MEYEVKKILIFVFIIMSFSSWKWNKLSLKSAQKPELQIHTHWIVDTVQGQSLRKSFSDYNRALITKDKVIVGNFIDGVKAYNKKKGKLIWDFSIPDAGVSKPLVADKESLYFGGRDGFFYSLFEGTGQLKWKYYTGSELAVEPLVVKDRVYFLTQDQKLYALSLEGKLIWIHAHSSQSQSLTLRGQSRLIVKNDIIYSAFQNGFVKALKVKDASLVWSNQLSGVAGLLTLKETCLLVSLFESYSSCLNPKNGKLLLSSSRKSIHEVERTNHLYLFDEKKLFAYIKTSSKASSKSDKTTQPSNKVSHNKGSYFYNRADHQEFQLLWQQKLKDFYPLPALLLEKYLVYGFSSYGKLQIVENKTGQLVSEYSFGKGLAGPLSFDPSDKSLYFLSASSYLYKISLK